MRKGWEIKNFEDVCELVGGSQPSKDEFIYEPKDGYIRLIQVRDYRTNNFVTYIPKDKAKRFCNKDDIMIGRYGPPIFGIFKGLEGAYNVALMKAVVNEKICYKGYFFWFLKTDSLRQFVEHSSKRAAGQDGVRKELLDKYPVLLPPLPEQQRIVSILDEAFSSIEQAKENLQRNLQNAKELFQSELNSIFMSKGEGWEETTLKANIELSTGFAFKSKFYTDNEDDILLLRGDNIMQGDFRWQDAKRWNRNEYEDYQKYQLQENDIVLAMDRPWVKAGLKCAKLTKNELPSLLVQRTARLRVNSKIDSSFLYHLIRSRGFITYLLKGQTGLGVPHISGPQILSFSFSRPSIIEQQKIVQQLDKLSAETKRLEAMYQQKLDALEELKKSILQKAFCGELS